MSFINAANRASVYRFSPDKHDLSKLLFGYGFKTFSLQNKENIRSADDRSEHVKNADSVVSGLRQQTLPGRAVNHSEVRQVWLNYELRKQRRFLSNASVRTLPKTLEGRAQTCVMAVANKHTRTHTAESRLLQPRRSIKPAESRALTFPFISIADARLVRDPCEFADSILPFLLLGTRDCPTDVYKLMNEPFRKKLWPLFFTFPAFLELYVTGNNTHSQSLRKHTSGGQQHMADITTYVWVCDELTTLYGRQTIQQQLGVIPQEPLGIVSGFQNTLRPLTSEESFSITLYLLKRVESRHTSASTGDRRSHFTHLQAFTLLGNLIWVENNNMSTVSPASRSPSGSQSSTQSSSELLVRIRVSLVTQDLQVKMLKKKRSALDTREKGGRAAPDVTLDDVVKDLIEYCKGFKGLQDAESEIKEKYNNDKDKNKDKNTTVWNEDDVKKAWGKTQRMNKYSRRRKTWSLAILLQAISDITLNKNNCSCENTPNTNEEPNAGTASQHFTCENTPNTNEEPNAGTESSVQAIYEITQTSPKKRRVSESSMNVPSKKKKSHADSQVYIRIPLSLLDVPQTNICQKEVKEIYKLIDGVPSFIQTMKKTSYVVQYDNRTKNAAWVFEILNEQTCMQKNIKEEDDGDDPQRVDNYRRDSMIPEHYTTPHNSYRKPYDRGHLAAASNHNWSQKAIDDTFLMSNIAPQNYQLNRGPWKTLEKECRDYIHQEKKYNNVYVYTGPLYCPEHCLKCDESRCENIKEIKQEIIGGKAVPTHFFKVVILEEEEKGTLDVKCYKVANAYNQTVQETNLDDIEKLSGLVFSEKKKLVSNEERVTVKWSAQEINPAKTHFIETTFKITPSQDSKEQDGGRICNSISGSGDECNVKSSPVRRSARITDMLHEDQLGFKAQRHCWMMTTQTLIRLNRLIKLE
ncbi:Endonuclease G, mitochondrial [Triplophysa tibetana]|uniref:Endonuclease G, mitochondrial n=1 Tax=Triplophysa tibetana TaxID=1572043 RepID=A0A5A9NUB2_9TELE|nr:Endonuclease G, mitochondrial [Triplophysa tibetana]